jgi:hypothetical protein
VEDHIQKSKPVRVDEGRVNLIRATFGILDLAQIHFRKFQKQKEKLAGNWQRVGRISR